MMTSDVSQGTTHTILSREEASPILDPYLERLNRCIEHGWSAWTNEYSAKHSILSARSRASIVFDEISTCAMAEFLTDKSVRIVLRRGLLLFYFGEKITLRFKKLRKDGTASNIPTLQQQLFSAQLEFPGMPPATLVHAGYQLDNLQQKIISKHVVCQLNKIVQWNIPLTGTLGVVTTMPAIPEPESGSPARFSVKIGYLPDAEKKTDGAGR